MSWAQESRVTHLVGACRSPAPSWNCRTPGGTGVPRVPGRLVALSLSQISLAQRFLSAPSCSHLPAITGSASPSHCSSEMHYLYLPETKNWLAKNKKQPTDKSGYPCFSAPITTHSQAFCSPQLIFWEPPDLQSRF